MHAHEHFFLVTQLCENITFETVEKRMAALNRWKDLDQPFNLSPTCFFPIENEKRHQISR